MKTTKSGEELAQGKNSPRRKRKVGRPRKTRQKRRDPRKIRRKFEETRVGYFLKYEAPVEYHLVTTINISGAPSADLVEHIGYASRNPLFKKAKFRKALLEYRLTGLYPPSPKKQRPSSVIQTPEKKVLTLFKK